MNETQKQAIEKIEKETKEFKGDKYGRVIYMPVAETLKQFCGNEQFAAAVLGSDKTLSDCCKEVTKGVKGSLSDIEAYKRAVQFYFPGADIKIDMRIILSGAEEVVDEKSVESVENNLPESAPSNQSEYRIISLFDVL